MAVGAAIAAGALSLAGGAMANRARRKEAARNRQFQERMRNTQWQAAVADMEAAGLNPALAYSQGPNAAPGGSMAQQMDAVSPAISSGMAAKRMEADLKLIRTQTQKTRDEQRSAAAAADLAEGRLKAYGMERRPDGSLKMTMDPASMPWIAREVHAGIRRMESEAARSMFTGQAIKPIADLSNRMGEWLPILGLMSQFSPGGIIRSFRNKKIPLKVGKKGGR